MAVRDTQSSGNPRVGDTPTKCYVNRVREDEESAVGADAASVPEERSEG